MRNDFVTRQNDDGTWYVNHYSTEGTDTHRTTVADKLDYRQADDIAAKLNALTEQLRQLVITNREAFAEHLEVLMVYADV